MTFRAAGQTPSCQHCFASLKLLFVPQLLQIRAKKKICRVLHLEVFVCNMLIALIIMVPGGTSYPYYSSCSRAGVRCGLLLPLVAASLVE